MPTNRKYQSGIYQIVCKANSKRYIGSAVDLERRERHHFNQLRRGVHPNRFLQRAFLKYGEKSFEFFILEYCESTELLTKEQNWLDVIFDKCRACYNMCSRAGSGLGRKHSAKARQKMSLFQKGRKHGPHSEETRKKIGNANKGKKHSEATKRLISKVGIGRRHTEETKKKMSLSRMRNTNSLGYKHPQAYKDRMSSIIKEWWKLRKEKSHSSK